MTFKSQKAVSQVFSILLLVIITFVTGILLYSFTMGMFGDLTAPSNTPFSLSIENVAINDTCMTIYVRNWLDHDVAVARIYINNEPKEIFRSTDSGAIIPKASAGAVEVVSTYVVGDSYDIKVSFTSGNNLMTYARY
jgi:hypothetical protein